MLICDEIFKLSNSHNIFHISLLKELKKRKNFP